MRLKLSSNVSSLPSSPSLRFPALIPGLFRACFLLLGRTQNTGHRLIQVEIFFCDPLNILNSDFLKPLRPRLDIRDGPAIDEAPAIAPRQAHLAVATIYMAGNIGIARPVQFLLAGPVLNEFSEDRIDRKSVV